MVEYLKVGFVLLGPRRWKSRVHGTNQSKESSQCCRDLRQERHGYQEDRTKIDDRTQIDGVVSVVSAVRAMECQRNSVGSERA